MKIFHEKHLPQHYKTPLKILRKKGYNPLYCTSLILEQTWAFQTEEEAIHAFEEFEKNPKRSILQGWWYDEQNFFKSIKEKEEKWQDDIRVYKLFNELKH